MENKRWKVLVNGMGNIGTTLANLLLRYQAQLNIETVYVAKRTLQAWNLAERKILVQQGAVICTYQPAESVLLVAEVLPVVDYIFEATANGVGLANLPAYKQLPNLKGSSAQGSEKGYGIPFMSGVNDKVISGKSFVNVVSCNTHGSAALLKTFTGQNLENLANADVVVVRRSEDIGNHQRLVSANVVARHLDPSVGTHHSMDVIDMYKTLGINCPLTSSDITTPSQLMHSVRFNITFKRPLTESIEVLIKKNPFMATTQKFDSNIVFELGRRYGFNGRIFSHAIVLTGNLLVTENSVKGWAFVPQEGNSLLSTLHAYILQMNLPNGTRVFDQIKADLLRSEW